MTNFIPLSKIEMAHSRLKDRIRRTPFLRARHLTRPIEGAGCFMKLESLQVTGSFKARGAMNALLSLSDDEKRHGITTASGGSHGAALAWAAMTMNIPARIFLPQNTPDEKIAKLQRYGCDVEIIGDVWDDANQSALDFAKKGAAYIHPFADEAVIAGQGTIGLEMMKQSPEVNTFLVAIGGGGLISGITSAIKQVKPDARIIGVEATGAPTLYNSLKAGSLQSLETIDTKANTLAPRRSADLNFAIISEGVDDIILVNDDEMRDSALWLWQEFGINTELAGAAAMAALRTGKVTRAIDEPIGVVVCGSGIDGAAAEAALSY